MHKRNIVLIGMPSSGKSTIGPLLARSLGMEFVDTDVCIKTKENKNLKDIVIEYGHEKFLEIQEAVVLDLDIHGCVIATGGSIVYSHGAMMHLKETGTVVYLQLGLQEIEERIVPGRRLARSGGQSFEDIYNERVPLYERYADVIVNCSGKSEEKIVENLISSL